MKLNDKNAIRIYHSLWKNLLLIIGCLAFTIGGCLIVKNPYTDWPTKVFGGFLSIIFFGGGGILIAVVTLYNRLRQIPFLIIHEGRLELYELRKKTYHTVNFADVKRFRFLKDHSPKMIAIDYLAAPLIHKFDDSSELKQKLMALNFHETGAIENIAVHNLTMKGQKICDILNERLLAPNSYSLESIGVNGIAYPKNEAIKIVDCYLQSNTPILGGDVYILENGTIKSSNDSWYCDSNDLEKQSDYVIRSHKETIEYITKYPETGKVLFSFVTNENN